MMLFGLRRPVLVGIAGALLLLFYLNHSASRIMALKDEQLREQKQIADNAISENQRQIERIEQGQRQLIDQLSTDWRNIEKQIQELRRPDPGSNLHEQLAFQFPYEERQKFPAFIWQTSKYSYSDSRFDSKSKSAVDSWSEQNKDFVHEVLSDSSSAALVRHYYRHLPSVIEAYDSLPYPILKADFFRYLILLARGGIYSDVDTVSLKSVLEWIPSNVDPTSIGLVIGIEADPDRPDWQEWYARRIQFCQWTIQAKAGHPILRAIVEKITSDTLERKRRGTLTTILGKDKGGDIMEWTGPGAWTDAVFDYFHDPVRSGVDDDATSSDWNTRAFSNLQEPKQVSDVLVLPITSFSPGVNNMGAKDTSNPLAYVQHLFGGTWKPSEERM